MINKLDVITLRIPFPDISSKLAVQSHMYIVRSKSGSYTELVKAQRIKPYMLINNPLHHFWDETPNLSRNPFTAATRVDCDKIFTTNNVLYDIKLRTKTRPNIEQVVLNCIEKELNQDGYMTYNLPSSTLVSLNFQTSLIP